MIFYSLNKWYFFFFFFFLVFRNNQWRLFSAVPHNVKKVWSYNTHTCTCIYTHNTLTQSNMQYTSCNTMCVNITECTRYTFSAQISLTNLTAAAGWCSQIIWWCYTTSPCSNTNSRYKAYYKRLCCCKPMTVINNSGNTDLPSSIIAKKIIKKAEKY